jgi:hypothetical protein
VERCCELINLVNLGCGFARELYKFGRYYTGQYPFLIDLNVILGMDLRESYNSLHMSIYRLWKMWQTLPQPTQQLLNELIEDINRMNELMYVVFYNTYNYSELKYYLPNWIRLEQKQPTEQIDSPMRKFKPSYSKEESRISTTASCKKSSYAIEWNS